MNIVTGKQEHLRDGVASIERLLKSQPEYVKGFYYYIRNSGKTASYRTQKAYVDHVIRFLDRTDKAIDEITMDDITCYLSQLSIKADGTEASGSYLVAVYSALKKFFNYLEFSERIRKNPMTHIERPRPKKAELVNRTCLNKKEIRKCMKAIEEIGGTYMVRDKAIMTILLTTGIRNTCLTEINVDNIDFENNCIYVIDKGTKPRTCWIDEEKMQYIKDWVEQRNALLGEGSSQRALFITNKCDRMSNQATAAVVRKVTGAIGHQVSPHKIRATYCTNAYNSGIPVEIVSKLMNHSTIKVTMDCYIQDQEQKVKDASIKAAHSMKF